MVTGLRVASGAKMPIESEFRAGVASPDLPPQAVSSRQRARASMPMPARICFGLVCPTPAMAGFEPGADGGVEAGVWAQPHHPPWDEEMARAMNPDHPHEAVFGLPNGRQPSSTRRNSRITGR